jgi:hypothetical protein
MPPNSVQAPDGFGQRFLLFWVQHIIDDTLWVTLLAKMPFEPLRTDEKLDKPVKPERDMDAVMLAGCSGFIVTAFSTYILGIWPFMVFGSTQLLQTLALDLVCALVPSLVLGIIATRKLALPGACGYIGGSMSVCVFIFIRLKQIISMVGSPELPQAQYPESWVTLIPLLWLVVAILTVIIFLPRNSFN